MNVINDTIYFKSTDEFYFKEKKGIKPNTVRCPINYGDASYIIDFKQRIKNETLFIQIANSINPHLTFKRTIRDISKVPNSTFWVFSWFHDEGGVVDGYNAPLK